MKKKKLVRKTLSGAEEYLRPNKETTKKDFVLIFYCVLWKPGGKDSYVVASCIKWYFDLEALSIEMLSFFPRSF